MKDYPASTPVQLADGFYVEQSLGVSGGALAYGDADNVRCRITPFINREAFDAMLRLPESYKLARRFQRDLIAHNWPELARTPFNRRAGVRYVIDRARRRAWLLRHGLVTAFKGS
jgi:hypothetical protein